MSYPWPSESSNLWPSEDGWPYPDTDDLIIDLRDGYTSESVEDFDHELVALHSAAPHLFDELSPLERQVVKARFGLDGYDEESMKQIKRRTGASKKMVRVALGSGIGKIRRQIS